MVYKNWMDSNSRVNEGVPVGSCRISRFNFVDILVLFESSQDMKRISTFI